MLEEKAALEGVRSHSVLELIRSPSLRWQLLTILVGFTGLQLCGINAVSRRTFPNPLGLENLYAYQESPSSGRLQ